MYVKIMSKRAKLIAESDFWLEVPAKIRSSAFSPRPEMCICTKMYQNILIYHNISKHMIIDKIVQNISR